MRLLVIDDDCNLAQSIIKTLVHQNYVVDIARDGQSGWDLATSYSYDLIILDIMIPMLDGLSLCQKLRHQGYQIPILLLTACNSNLDKVSGLDAGADDYIVKPFCWQEFLARIRALLRRQARQSLPTVLQWGNLQLNPVNCQVTWKDTILLLRPKEYSLLELFLRHPDRVFSCGMILDQLWSFEDLPGEETVRAHIKGLRQKLKNVGMQDAIATVYGLGYRWKTIEETQNNSVQSNELLDLPHVSTNLKEVLVNAWEEIKPSVLQQVNFLEQAAISFDITLQEQAIADAHKLAGLVGAFGFEQGTKLSRTIEALFQAGLFQETKKNSSLKNAIAALRQELSSPVCTNLNN